ncbi:MAG: hypothetical protein ACREBW_06490 [Candidatus Micrarchaeaceae archaeon]
MIALNDLIAKAIDVPGSLNDKMVEFFSSISLGSGPPGNPVPTSGFYYDFLNNNMYIARSGVWVQLGGGIASIGGPGVNTPGGEIYTLNSGNASRNVLDDGFGGAIMGNLRFAFDGTNAYVQLVAGDFPIAFTHDYTNDLVATKANSITLGPGTASAPSGAKISSGTGVPVIEGTIGDYFLRTDAPSTANERIYICTVAGAAGAATWVGIV